MRHAPHTVRHWTGAEYDRLVDLGVFEGEPLELIDGQLIVAEPKGTPNMPCEPRFLRDGS